MRLIASLACAAALLAVAVPAGAQTPQPGQWTVTLKTQVAGQPARESTNASCITPEMAKNPEAAFASGGMDAQGNCKKSFNRSGATFSWQFECTGAMTMTGAGSITFDSPTHYAGSIKVSGNAGGRPIEVTTLMDGRRTGDCAK